MQNYILNNLGIKVPLYSWEERRLPDERLKGNNEKGVLVLSRADDIPEQLVLLKKILRAVDLDFDNDISFSTVEPHERFAVLSDELVMENAVILTFGVPPEALGISTPAPAKLLEYEGLTVILAPALSQLEQSPESKRELWFNLKRTFTGV